MPTTALGFALLLLCVLSMPAAPADERCAHLESRLAAIERALGVGEEDDTSRVAELSYLELIASTASKLVYDLAKPTDKECRFSYETFTCYPKCECSFQFKFGDYWPDRSCRRRPAPAHTCESSDDPPVMRVVAKQLRKTAVLAATFIRDHAPPTDDKCRFSYSKLRCVPETTCFFYYQFGDFSPDRSCRLL